MSPLPLLAQHDSERLFLRLDLWAGFASAVQIARFPFSHYFLPGHKIYLVKGTTNA